MSPQPLGELRRDVYRQRQRVALLSQHVYGRGDPSEAADDMDRLQSAAEELGTLERALADAERDERAAAAVVLSTHPNGDGGGMLMGADTTGIEATVSLRMSHVPTGVVHLL